MNQSSGPFFIGSNGEKISGNHQHTQTGHKPGKHALELMLIEIVRQASAPRGALVTLAILTPATAGQ